ncbi:uncharacterized protein LOC132192788 [Neocloeon triangulifer]|uniref:uncharacterized protein LOC132192788 n=1 Tax=Neocloeon triangulifer TaxID=2078957 RepID=UPI00286EB95C|nr:uncharacterized protein LOC132192788 [Neocloeon triangulifer]
MNRLVSQHDWKLPVFQPNSSGTHKRAASVEVGSSCRPSAAHDARGEMDSPVKTNKARLARTRLVLVLGILSIIIGQIGRNGDRRRPQLAAYVRPNRPSMFTIKRGSRLIVNIDDLVNKTSTEPFTMKQTTDLDPLMISEMFIQKDASRL